MQNMKTYSVQNMKTYSLQNMKTYSAQNMKTYSVQNMKTYNVQSKTRRVLKRGKNGKAKESMDSILEVQIDNLLVKTLRSCGCGGKI